MNWLNTLSDEDWFVWMSFPDPTTDPPQRKSSD